MDNISLDSIYENYINNKEYDESSHVTALQRQFVTKYVEPLLEKDFQEGTDMETLLNMIKYESGRERFKAGFKACMNLIKESEA